MEIADIDIRQIKTMLIESREHVTANLRNAVAIFAVASKTPADDFELKCIPFDLNNDTSKFDSELFMMGTSPF